jgi:hypothetical protein
MDALDEQSRSAGMAVSSGRAEGARRFRVADPGLAAELF